MGLYTRRNDTVVWREQYIYGSSRIGLYRPDTLINKGLRPIQKLFEGKRNYELTNHLGNVLATISDRKTDVLIGSIKTYDAVVLSASDYYPFGMMMDSRSFSVTQYRFGFNGKETDAEWAKQDYGLRIYDAALGRFLSIDPLSKKYPELTPYQFASNTPIQVIDLDGLEELHYFISQKDKYVGLEMIIKILNETGIAGEIKKSFGEGNNQTDMYYHVENIRPSGHTEIYAGYKSVRGSQSLEQKRVNQNRRYAELKSQNGNMNKEEANFVWRETFSIGKGAIVLQLNESEIEKAGKNLGDLAEMTLTAIHEPVAHGINSKNGINLKSDFAEHSLFNGKESQMATDPTGAMSPNYENIDPKSPAGKYKERIETYINGHKNELLNMMKENKKDETKNSTIFLNIFILICLLTASCKRKINTSLFSKNNENSILKILPTGYYYKDYSIFKIAVPNENYRGILQTGYFATLNNTFYYLDIDERCSEEYKKGEYSINKKNNTMNPPSFCDIDFRPFFSTDAKINDTISDISKEWDWIILKDKFFDFIIQDTVYIFEKKQIWVIV